MVLRNAAGEYSPSYVRERTERPEETGKIALQGAKMKIIQTRELECLVRQTFRQKGFFSARAELNGTIPSHFVIFVHGGADPYLDPHFDAWLGGSPTFVSTYQIMNGLCRAGALAPGEYGLLRSN
jgi:hypothetical protein